MQSRYFLVSCSWLLSYLASTCFTCSWSIAYCRAYVYNVSWSWLLGYLASVDMFHMFCVVYSISIAEHMFLMLSDVGCLAIWLVHVFAFYFSSDMLCFAVSYSWLHCYFRVNVLIVSCSWLYRILSSSCFVVSCSWLYCILLITFLLFLVLAFVAYMFWSFLFLRHCLLSSAYFLLSFLDNIWYCLKMFYCSVFLVELVITEFRF